MRVHSEEHRHPTQASRVRLSVFELDRPQGSAFGMGSLLEKGRVLVTEDRIGTSTVVATLGLFTTREEALALVSRRAAELLAQKYTPVAKTA
jgi:hypothetical protein